MSPRHPCPHVVILGAGPAGCTLAGLLGQRGFDVTVCDDEKRPDLLVGESLIPGVVPVFRQLGIEDRVAAISTRKPGSSFFTTEGYRLHFHFSTVERQMPGYSYNTPRPELDNLLRERAVELGARFVKVRAGVERCQRDGQPALRLDERTRAVIGLPPACMEEPLLIDATGRARLFSRTLNLKARSGKRNDVAYFAHFENFTHDEVEPGQVIISVLTHGWGWRIPLPGRLSVGIVVDKEHAQTLGNTPGERLENAIRSEPLLRDKGRNARRVTPVMTYTNYQLLSERGHGPGWVLAGDAFGFVDPMLSPGLFMSLEAARSLDEEVFRHGPGILRQPNALEQGLRRYEANFKRWHHSWTDLIEYFYDGRIFQLDAARQHSMQRFGEKHAGRWMERHTSYHIASMACGGNTCARYSRGLVKFLSRYLIWGVPPAETFAVR